MSAISKYSNYSQFKNVDSKVNAMIQFDKSGQVGQIIGSDGANGLIWVSDDPSSASYWSEYPATQTVDIATNDIENIANLTAEKIKIGELSYQSAFPIGIECAFNENTFTTGLLAQNKDSADASSVSILLTNNLGSDSAYYGGLTMFSSNTVPAYGFPSIKNAISLNSQSSSIVVSPWNGQQDGTANENGNIMLTYSGGSKAHIINNNGQLIVGADNPSYSGSTYGGDNGGTDNVLTSDGTNGLKWITPEYAPLWSEFLATQTVDINGNDIENVNNLTASNIVVETQSPILLPLPNINTSLDIVVITATPINVAPYNMTPVSSIWPVQVNSNTTNMVTGVTYYAKVFGPSQLQLNTSPDGGVPTIIDTTDLASFPQPILSLVSGYNPQTATLSDTLNITTVANTSILSSLSLTFDGVPYSRNMINSSLVYSSALIYADGSPPATNLAIRNTYSYNGWFFAKTAPGTDKVNWYLGAQSNDTTVSEIKGIAMSFFNQLASSNDYLPFITIYTQPQPGDLTFYHSKRTYIFDQSLSPILNTAYQGCVFVDPTLIPYYRETQVEYELAPVGQVGPFASDEQVLAITIGSDSAAPVNETGFVVSKLNIIYDTFTQSLDFVPP